MSESSDKKLFDEKAKEAIAKYEWTDPEDPTKKLRWVQILPPQYAENDKIRGLEVAYINTVSAKIKEILGVIQSEGLTGRAVVKEKYKTLLAPTLNEIFQKRYNKTKEMEKRGRSKSVGKTTGVAAEGTGTTAAKKPRAPRRTDEEIEANLERQLAERRERTAAKKSEEAIKPRINELAGVIAGKNISELTSKQLAHYRGRSKSVLKEKPNVSSSNARALNKTLRAASRARSAAKKAAASTGNNNAASVSTTRSTTRKRTEGMAMEELCAIANKLQENSFERITLDDVRAYIKQKKIADKKIADKKSFSALAALNSNEE